MNTSLRFLFSAIAIASLAACGGGDSTPVADSSVPGGSTTPPAATAAGAPPALSATPTAVLQGSQAEADKLAAEAKTGLAGASTAANAANLPTGIQTASLPTGAVVDMSAFMCKTGTATVDSNATGTNLAGTKTSMVFTNCALSQLSGYVYNGSYSQQFTRYTGPTDFATQITYTNLSLTIPGLATQTYSGSITCDYKGAVNFSTSCYYSDDTRAWGSISYSGNAATGTYATNYGSGTIKVTYSNFGTAGGTATVTGSNGYSAVISWDSATSYTVKITVNGSTSTYTSKV